MLKYIKKKMTDAGGDRSFARAALALDAIRRSSLPQNKIKFPMRFNAGVYEKTCNKFVAKSAFNQVTAMQTEIALLKKDRKKDAATDHNILRGLAIGSQKILESCVNDDGIYDYFLIALIHAQLLLDDHKVAANFKSRAVTESFSNEQQLQFFFDHFGTSEEKLAQVLLSRNAFPEHTIESPALKLLLGVQKPRKKGSQIFTALEILDREESMYLIFKKKVDFGKVCDATTILFKDLSAGPNYEIAVNYMVKSPRINPTAKYSCGDEDLELLLK